MFQFYGENESNGNFSLAERLKATEDLKFLLPIKVKKWLKIRNATLSCVNAKVGWWKDTPN